MPKVKQAEAEKCYQVALQRLGNSGSGKCWLAIAIGIETGARISEIVSLTSEDILDSFYIRVKQTKTKTVRDAAVSQEVYNTLCFIAEDDDLLFRWVSYSVMYSFLKKNYPAALFERTAKHRTITHILRKIAVRRKFESGYSLSQIKKLFGWKSAGSLEFYL